MERYEDEGGEDSDNETDPEQLLNEWLGELDSLTVVSLYKLENLYLLAWVNKISFDITSRDIYFLIVIPLIIHPSR